MWPDDSSNYFHEFSAVDNITAIIQQDPKPRPQSITEDYNPLWDEPLLLALKLGEGGKDVGRMMVAAGMATLMAAPAVEPDIPSLHVATPPSAHVLPKVSGSMPTSDSIPANTPGKVVLPPGGVVSLTHSKGTNSPSRGAVYMLPPTPLPASIGDTFKCCVVCVDSLHPFYIHVEKNEASMSWLTLALRQLNVEATMVLDGLVVGQAALALYEGNLCRVTYQGPGSTPHSCSVLYVDYGNLDEVSGLIPISDALTTIPPFAYPCSLHPFGSSNEPISLEVFHKQVVGRQLTAVLEVGG